MAGGGFFQDSASNNALVPNRVDLNGPGHACQNKMSWV
jgi:hypothetical protein